jgi:hypothetical protein
MLVAWFADATPPVLWRWRADEMGAGFGIQRDQDKVSIVKYESGMAPSPVATFANELQASHALSLLSREMLKRESRVLKIVKSVLSLLGVVFLSVCVYAFIRTAVFHANLFPGQAANEAAAAAPQAQQAVPSMAAPAAMPVPPPMQSPPEGSSIDVDSYYAKTK